MNLTSNEEKKKNGEMSNLENYYKLEMKNHSKNYYKSIAMKEKIK